ncbi:uncharacterized protein LOC143634477 [Bidens hawaiensis]|uniref:uncharacterized protein LOC143634477 n=1 Tax=Bidens hawaiensis TaxID=980011 RepID=UPI00404AE208
MASHYNVQWNGGDLYQVSGRPGIPCEHVVAAIWYKAVNGGKGGSIESWVHPVHTMDRWRQVDSFKINPINGRPLWPKSEVPTVLTPPKHNKQAGRPKKVRKRSAVELEEMTQGGKLSRKETKGVCSKCGSTGHNVRTCTKAG